MRRARVHILAILLLIGLGSGLTQALHHAVAHSESSAGEHCCASTCSAIERLAETTDESPAPDHSHDREDCPACVTLASITTVVPELQPCVIAPQPTFERTAPVLTHPPQAAPQRIARTRAPPVR